MFNAVNKLWLSAACMKNMELDSHSTKKLPVWKKIWVGGAAWKHVKLTYLHLQKLLPPHVTNTVATGKKMDIRQGREVGPEVHLHRKKDWGMSGSFQSVQLRQRSRTQTDTSENKGPGTCSRTLRHRAFSRLELDMEPVAFLTRDSTCIMPRPRPETFG